MARFLSFQKISSTTVHTILRFPLETLTALLGTIASCYAIANHQNKELNHILMQFLLCCSLWLVLFLSLSLYFTKNQKHSIYRFGLSTVFGAAIAWFVFNFSEPIKSFELFQFLALSLALHLLVSFAGFISTKYQTEIFWEFNKQLFLRILTAALYSMVIYAGLSFALLAIKLLFEVELADKIYFYLFCIIAGIFNTLFFLAGVPDTTAAATTLKWNYPVGLKKFTQYVLMPLISIYFVILLAYEFKIIATLSLPIGWVSNLILVFAIFGILSLLLIYPIAKDFENAWVKIFYKWFYYLLVPLLGLLFWAIIYRINLYGFTHERYFVLMLALWLSMVTIYFIFKKNPEIKYIPVSLCIMALATITGPQSANSVSKKSQLNRFASYVINNPKTNLSIKEEHDLSSVVAFLTEHYGAEVLIPYSGKIKELVQKDKNPTNYEIVEALGHVYRGSYRSNTNTKPTLYYNYYNSQNQEITAINGYDFAFTIDDYNALDCTNCIQQNLKSYSFKTATTDYGIALIINDEVVPIKIKDFVNQTSAFKSADHNSKILQHITTPKYELVLHYQSITMRYSNNETLLDTYQIKALLKIKEN
ncbi:DUF4153 domain-containing protein [Flavobacterium crassostreae]|uniref:DUF4153 domain-containing protein n=1 Tax=Flavobacterium crassostreae TaxID=1763534 RepID=A0A1B9DZQ3_9FLAO|nr:DUF4153 domain-containing protein [Flavobacterium crassostreae]OCB75171.1 DUF4153 domain-containing protein [Flavobacterium crassostreae]